MSGAGRRPSYSLLDKLEVEEEQLLLQRELRELVSDDEGEGEGDAGDDEENEEEEGGFADYDEEEDGEEDEGYDDDGMAIDAMESSGEVASPSSSSYNYEDVLLVVRDGDEDYDSSEAVEYEDVNHGSFVPLMLPGEYFTTGAGGGMRDGGSEPLLVVHEATEEDATEHSIMGGAGFVFGGAAAADPGGLAGRSSSYGHENDGEDDVYEAGNSSLFSGTRRPPLPSRRDYRETSTEMMEPSDSTTRPRRGGGSAAGSGGPSLDPLYEDDANQRDGDEDETDDGREPSATRTGAVGPGAAATLLRGSFTSAPRSSLTASTVPTPSDFSYYYEDGSSSLASGISSETSYIWGGGATGGRRRSFASFNTAGSNSEAEYSLHSAASAGGGGGGVSSGRRESTRVSFSRQSSSSTSGAASHQTAPSPSTTKQQRRVTITVPKDDGSSAESPSPALTRRTTTSRYRSSRSVFRQASSSDDPFYDAGDFSSSSAVPASPSIFRSSARRSVLGRRTSTYNQPLRSSGGDGSVASGDGSAAMSPSFDPSHNVVAAAADRISESNSAWENAAAAATIVAASAQASAGKGRQHVQFGTDDWVLVLLNLLNIMNRTDDRSCLTVDPVNAFGYPAGEGRTEDERQGPYSYVLCAVREVHFDEDERYYTVERADTGTFQRADPGWMEPLPPFADNWAAAHRAAGRTVRSQSEVKEDNVKQKNMILLTPWRLIQSTLMPWYRRMRASTKVLAENIVMGKPGWACRIHFTCINLLVMCSFVYLFIEPVTLAFLPAYLDYAAIVFELVVWSVLMLELVLEYFIRPRSYRLLALSDKAYSPSTARFINRFHLFCEAVALALFVPLLVCIADKERCGDDVPLSLVSASLNAVLGTSPSSVAYGRLIMGLMFLRTFSLVRHWKQMWIGAVFEGYKKTAGPESAMLRQFLLLRPYSAGKRLRVNIFKRKKTDDDPELQDEPSDHAMTLSREEDEMLQNAKIGTALMIVNSHRFLVLLLLIVSIFPIIYSFGKSNLFAPNQVLLLQANNLVANSTEPDDCAYLYNAMRAWLRGTSGEENDYSVLGSKRDLDTYILWAQMLPVRCDWQRPDGVITECAWTWLSGMILPCSFWNRTIVSPADATPDYFADVLGVRVGGILEYQLNTTAPLLDRGLVSNQSYFVKVIVDETDTLTYSMAGLFLLLLTMLIMTLVGLSVMRSDAGRLVLDPLKKMLKIVIRYAEDPLSQTSLKKSGNEKDGSGLGDAESPEQLGNFETEQLINAISKIADLLRKCWGVAGAGIISENLRTKDGQTVVFNPMVKGKRVYALFGFIAINDFSKLLRDLENDVMILINDVARVVHDEVYRWALGDSGQCNKNLGSAFLMVFRIGDFTEVHLKKKRATDVVFSNSQQKRNTKPRRRLNGKRGVAAGTTKRYRRVSTGSKHFDIKNDGTLQLASLPGIQAFTDRALLGLLKSFAGIHRDRKLRAWRTDFRCSGGVGAFTANVIYGMDAGWAVEGAVGSEYKIDATYLSPHVNMASRMMSATKQYGVTILLSQAVEELLSKNARDKLRHLDTVYVKGSSVAQRIFTYDARFQGVDFFLFERPPDQADVEAESYSPSIWDVDQDLRAMRQHVTDDFMAKFREGVEHYQEGNWKRSIEVLQAADDLMIQSVIEQGYIDFDLAGLEKEVFNRKVCNEEVTRIRNEIGDGACKCLIQFMQRRNATAPSDWHGVRKLMSK